MAKKEGLFPEKEKYFIWAPPFTPIENRIFAKKAPNALKQSAGEQGKTTGGQKHI